MQTSYFSCVHHLAICSSLWSKRAVKDINLSIKLNIYNWIIKIRKHFCFMSHCVVPKRYPYLPIGWFFGLNLPPSPPLLPESTPLNFPKPPLWIYFWNSKIEKTIFRNFQSPRFSFISPCHSFDAWNVIFPHETLNKEWVALLALVTEPKLLAVKSPFITKYQEGLFLSTINFRLISSTCSAAADRVRHSSEILALPLLRQVDSPIVFA